MTKTMTKAERKRAEKVRQNERCQRRRAEARRRNQRAKRKHGREPELALPPWPDTTGMNDEDAARVIGEVLYWEDYHDRNPGSRFCAAM